MSQIDRDFERLYLDHASTSWPKRAGVVEAMSSFLNDCGASSARGQYAAARRAGQLVQQTRSKLAEQINAEDDSCITFHPGCTSALNVAIHGIVNSQDHVVVSAVEHNAILRPVYAATKHHDVVACDEEGRMQVRSLVDQIKESTRLIALTHASNVTGIIQPVSELSVEIAKLNLHRSSERKIIVLCDAAQTFGYLPIDVEKMGVDILAAPAHKGSGGPPGIALLYLRSTLHDQIQPMIQGGSGHDGLGESMPAIMPGRLEPGTMNVPAIAGWDAALDYSPSNSPSEMNQIANDLSGLARHLHKGLRLIDGVRVSGDVGELPIASIDFGPMLPPSDAASILDNDFSIDVRAGFHCAAQIHQCLGTQQNGTLRISCGHETSIEDVNRLIQAIKEIASSL